MQLTNSQKLVIAIVIITIVILLIILLLRDDTLVLECKGDDDCSGGNVCSKGKCVQCAFDTDCCASSYCKNNKCVKRPLDGFICTTCSMDQTSTLFENEINVDPTGYFWDGAVQSTGKIIALGSDVLTRYNLDGTRDTSFGTSGWIEIANDTPFTSLFGSESVEVDKNDNIYVCATGSNGGDSAHVVKFLPDGVLDSSFGTGGIVSLPFATTGNQQAMSLIFDNDDNIYFVIRRGGIFAKILSTGQLDTSFGTSGIATFTWNGNTMVDVDHWVIDFYNDKLYILCNDRTTYATLGVCRFNLDGTKDTTYGTNGDAVFDISTYFAGCTAPEVYCYCGGVAPDGSYYCVPSVSYDEGIDCGNYPIGVVKFTPDGQVDTNFANNGLFVDSEAPFYTTDVYSECYHRPAFAPCNGNMSVAVNSYQSGAPPDSTYILELTPEGTHILNSTYNSIDSNETYNWSSFPHPDGFLVTIGEHYETGDAVTDVYLHDCGNLVYSVTNRPW